MRFLMLTPVRRLGGRRRRDDFDSSRRAAGALLEVGRRVGVVGGLAEDRPVGEVVHPVFRRVARRAAPRGTPCARGSPGAPGRSPSSQRNCLSARRERGGAAASSCACVHAAIVVADSSANTPRRRDHTCLTADDTGLLKRVDVEKAATTQIWGVQAAGGGVERLPAGRRAARRASGCRTAPCASGTRPAAAPRRSASSPRTRAPASAPPASASTRRLLAVVIGRLAWWRATAPAASACSRRRPGGGDGDGDDDGANESGAAEPAHSFQAGRRRGGRARLAPPGDGEPQLATGGRGVDLAVWSVATGQPAWRARNVPHDDLELVVPVWVADARWLPGTPQTLVVGTGFVKERLRGEVRLYDVRAAAAGAPDARAGGRGPARRRRVHRRRPPRRRRLGSGTLVRLDVRGGMRAAGRTRAPPDRSARWRRRAAPSRASASTGCSACTAPPTARCASAST